MTDTQIIREHFTAFTREYARDGQLPRDLQDKVGHSLRVAADCRDIALELHWPRETVGLAEAVGVLHDVGRFEQFASHGTFNDGRSIDHAKAGAGRVREEAWLKGWGEAATRAACDAIMLHNRRELPPQADPLTDRLARLLRDADKIDIMHTFGQALVGARFTRYPQVFAGLDLDGQPSPGLVEDLTSGRPGRYDQIRSLADVALVGFSWLHDIHYVPSLQRIRDRRIVEGIDAVLPETGPVRSVVEQAVAAMQQRLDLNEEPTATTTTRNSAVV